MTPESPTALMPMPTAIGRYRWIVCGIGIAAGSIGGIIFPVVTGLLLDKFQAAGDITAGYNVLFLICAFAYLVAFALNHLLAPNFEEMSPAELED